MFTVKAYRLISSTMNTGKIQRFIEDNPSRQGCGSVRCTI
jgi:hypothetical protein